MSEVTRTTRQWIDMYSLILDRLAEGLADPKKLYAHLGISEEAGANIPHAMSVKKYKESRDSWNKVKDVMLLFGLEIGEDLLLAPETVLSDKAWNDNPWLEVSRPGDVTPLKFFGREAQTALGFISFFINTCDQVDPNKRVKRHLEAQGITKENFFQEVGLMGISDPWANERGTPAAPEKEVPYSVLSPDESVDRTPIQFPVPDALPAPETPPSEPPTTSP